VPKSIISASRRLATPPHPKQHTHTCCYNERRGRGPPSCEKGVHEQIRGQDDVTECGCWKSRTCFGKGRVVWGFDLCWLNRTPAVIAFYMCDQRINPPVGKERMREGRWLNSYFTRHLILEIRYKGLDQGCWTEVCLHNQLGRQMSTLPFPSLVCRSKPTSNSPAEETTSSSSQVTTV